MNRAGRNSSKGSTSAVLVAILVFASWSQTNAAGGGLVIPDPVVDSPLALKKGKQTAVLAGGCFWGVQDVFQHSEACQKKFQQQPERYLAAFMAPGYDEAKENRRVASFSMDAALSQMMST